MLCASAFLTPIEADKAITKVDDKLKAYRYAKMLADGGLTEVTIDDLAEIRKRVALVYHVALAGPALELLDLPADKKRD